MRKITLICVGKLKEKFWIDAIAEYTKRLMRFLDFRIIEIPECKPSNSITPEQILQKEGEKILEKIANKRTFILAIEGKILTSSEFANIIEVESNNGEVCFVIGSSYGIDEKIKQKYPLISFGRITFPHQLMRVVFTEQLYRAGTILNNIEYHK